jgi:hypothetical protein
MILLRTCTTVDFYELRHQIDDDYFLSEILHSFKGLALIGVTTFWTLGRDICIHRPPTHHINAQRFA